MLLNNKRKSFFIFILLLIIVNCAPSQTQKTTNKNKDQMGEAYISKIINLMSSPQNKELNNLMQKWSDYLIEYSGYSNADYIDAMSELEAEYGNALSKCTECYEKTKKLKQRHSSAWIFELKEEYGFQYIKDNKNAILSNIKISIGYHDTQCKEFDGMLLYREAELYAACKYYYKVFLKFNETLKENEKKALKTRRETVESFLELIDNNSIADILFNPTPPIKTIAEIQAKRRNPELYNWFKVHVNSDHFDSMRATEELYKITGYDN